MNFEFSRHRLQPPLQPIYSPYTAPSKWHHSYLYTWPPAAPVAPVARGFIVIIKKLMANPQ